MDVSCTLVGKGCLYDVSMLRNRHECTRTMLELPHFRGHIRSEAE